MSEDEKGPKDWGVWERQGVPVLDFLLACFDGEIPANPEVIALKVEWLTELWLAHHPKNESVASEAWTLFETSAQGPKSIFIRDEPGGITGRMVTLPGNETPATICQEKSLADPEGVFHFCELTKGHIHPHEGDGWKWFSIGPESNKKPFKAKA